MTQTINVLGGSGKVMQSAIIPGIIERSNCNVLSVTRNTSLNGINRCILSEPPGIEYPILVQKSNEKTLQSFINIMDENEIRVGVIFSESELFIEMIKRGNGGFWFSACRDNLYKIYLPAMEKYITKPTHIFVFDNDESVVIKARAVCQNPNIKFHRCIVHSVCTSIHYDYTTGTACLTNGRECMLIFPPTIPNLRNIFHSTPFWGRAEFKFASTENDFHYYVMWKLLGINAIHTLAAVKAYIIGIKTGTSSLEEISKKHFSDLISKEDLLTHALRVYTLLYDKYLAPYTETLNTYKDVYTTITQNFICGLYDLNEIIGRGLDPTHTSFQSKLDRHFSILRDSNDSETITMLDEFLTLI